MRQIIRQRDIVADAWRYPGEEGDGPQAVTLAAFAAAVAAGTAPMSGAGVWLEPADDVAGLAPQLARVALVVVNFPKNGEGRGFTQGQLLRQRCRLVADHERRTDLRVRRPGPLCLPGGAGGSDKRHQARRCRSCGGATAVVRRCA